MTPVYSKVAERALDRCEYCHAPEIVFNLPLEMDHIVPRSQGGDDALDNLSLACRACNLFKSDFETGIDREGGMEASLFHPRRDVWTEHFRIDLERAEVVGISAIGRATVRRLQMNRPHQINARRHWMQLGLFP